MKRTAAAIIITMLLAVMLATVAGAQKDVDRKDASRKYAFMLLQDDQYREIMLLMRLAPLDLSADQIDGILQVLDENMPGPDPQMDDLHDRLLRGEEMAASDRMIMRDAVQGWMDANAMRKVHQAAEMIRMLLSPEQTAMLTNKWGGRAAKAPDKYAAATMLRALAEFVKTGDDAKRTEQAAKIVDAVTQSVDPAMAEAQIQDMEDFVGRVGDMSETQFGAQREELQAELEIILPDGFDPAGFQATLNPERLHRQIIQTFMTGPARDLLEQMYQARSNAAGP